MNAKNGFITGVTKKTAVITAILLFLMIFCGCSANNKVDEGQRLIRIHIRADSNSAADQQVKLKVRDRIVTLFDTELQGVNSFDQAYSVIGGQLNTVRSVSDGVLATNGFEYRSTVRLTREYFPARSYGGVTVESGTYDALIVELGSGKGDNWWCVVYPPLCFTDTDGEGETFAYKSKIAELWKKFMG